MKSANIGKSPASYISAVPGQGGNAEPVRTNWRVFAGASAVILGTTIWAIVAPTQAEEAIGGIVNWASQKLGWVYIVTLTVVLGFVIFLACSRFGSIRLGPDHSRPKYKLGTWTAMLFAAGIGVDLMFYSVAGPVAQYLAPPTGSPETVEAARQSIVWTTFHYGISGWSLYALVGAALGYYAYRFKMPLSIRAALYPLIGKRIHGRSGDAVDVAATVATVFGLTASLGIGVLQLNFGLTYLFGWPEHIAIQIGLVLLGVAMATVSCVSGVDRGIRRLSELNFLLALGLMACILFSGKATMLVDAIVMNLGQFISRFSEMTLETFAYDRPDDWMNAWTLFFWAWWIAWSPFVGMFLARISRGRTIREFVIGVLVVPFLFTLIWISIFGNSAVDAVRSGNQQFGEITMATPEHGFYMLLDQYPGATFVAGIATFTGLLFYVTSADSGALMMSNFTSRTSDPSQDGPKWSRIFWALAVGALTLAMLFVGGFATIQYMTIIMALPFTVILYLMMAAFWKSLKQEEASLLTAGRRATGQSTRQWRKRLARTITTCQTDEANTFLRDIAEPAMREVADEFLRMGLDASLSTAMVPTVAVQQLDLTVTLDRQLPFRYQVYPVLKRPASGSETSPDSADLRLEVFSATGSSGYDVMGLTRKELISDLVDRFEMHMAAGRKQTVSVDMTPFLKEPSNWSEDFTDQ